VSINSSRSHVTGANTNNSPDVIRPIRLEVIHRDGSSLCELCSDARGA